MLTATDWGLAIAGIASELREQSQIREPPVDALAIARAARLIVAVDRMQPGRGRIKRIAGQPTIFLRPEERPERLQWAAAHELGESQIGKICRWLGLHSDDLAPRQREALANRIAREILLPLDWFRRGCDELDHDLLRLKARFRTASHELIAGRWLDLERPAMVTIFDQGSLTRRLGNGLSRPAGMTELERRCWTGLRQNRGSVCRSDECMCVRGWCVDSAGWEREILYAALTE
jgi:Zn-dependent peptidase ImmA (M78 family)